MRRFLTTVFGVLWLLLALVVALAVISFVHAFDDSYDVNIRNVSIATTALLLALVASASSVMLGLRCIAPQRFAFPRFRHLGALSGVAMILTLGAAGGSIYEIEHRPRHSAAAVAGVNKPFELAFTAIDGRTVDVARLKGKVVVIDFWATWCGPCVAEISGLKQLYDEHHAAGLEIIGISLDTDRAKLENFVGQREVPWPQYFDGREWKNKIARRFDIRGVPQLYLVDKQGRLRDLDGRLDLARKVGELLAE